MVKGGCGVRQWMYLVLVMGNMQVFAAGQLVAECGSDEGGVEMRLAVADGDSTVRVAYLMPKGIRTLELSWPNRGGAERMAHLVVESDGVEVDGRGRMLFREPVREVSVVVSPEPPEQRYGAQYPTAFAVDGRGIAVYVPYLMPKLEGCGAPSVILAGSEGFLALVDGDYVEVKEDHEIADQSGFVLLGRNLEANSAVQLPTTLPTWLDELIRESNENAHRGLVRVLGAARRPVSVLVDYFVEGSTGGPRNGGDAAGEHCSMRLWFRGKGWEEQSDELGERVYLLLAHELAHCYQEGETWLQWAHEGHARFLESLISARPNGDYLSGTFAEERLVRNFDACMNDLRVGDRHIDAYSCGSVAYWLRWLETGRVTMLEEKDVQNPKERQTFAGRFLLRTVTPEGVVEFLRDSGIAVEVEEDVDEGERAVRSRLVMTLLEHGCPTETGPSGLWTNEASITLDGCPEFDRFEVEAIAGQHVIEDVHRAYEESVASCRAEGKVALTGVGGEVRWIRCDPGHDWPSTVATGYRLVSPFAVVPTATQ